MSLYMIILRKIKLQNTSKNISIKIFMRDWISSIIFLPLISIIYKSREERMILHCYVVVDIVNMIESKL